MEAASRPDPHLSSWTSTFEPILGEKLDLPQMMKALLRTSSLWSPDSTTNLEWVLLSGKVRVSLIV